MEFPPREDIKKTVTRKLKKKKKRVNPGLWVKLRDTFIHQLKKNNAVPPSALNALLRIQQQSPVFKKFIEECRVK